MNQVPISVWSVFVSCESDSCTLRKECTNHCTAGDYRSDYGVRPELCALEMKPGSSTGTVFCKTYNISEVDSEKYGYDSITHPERVTMGEYVTYDEISSQMMLL